MKIVFDQKSGIYYAYAKSLQGNPCLGYSESRQEAMTFCYELVQNKRDQCLKGVGA